MSNTSDIQARAKHALLTDLRQKLLAPVNALLGYGQLLQNQATEARFEEFAPDFGRIVDATEKLHHLVDSLVSDTLPADVDDMSDVSAEWHLRHELITPLNAIKGYSEMLLEDIVDQTVSPGADLSRMLQESENLLQDLDELFRFFNQRGAHPSEQKSTDETDVMQLIDSIKPVDATTIKPAQGRILVVDDIESNRNLLLRQLRHEGHEVSMASNGHEALHRLQKETYDLVLLDLMMPGLNGYETLVRMRADSQLRNIPVIMISALDEADGVLRCIESGAHDYLSKPVDPVMLKARIASGLESKRWSDEEIQQRQFIKQAFSKFLSPAVVDQLAEDPSRLSLGGERMEISCLFTDLEGFTGLIETHEPSRVLPVLNRYLDGLCQIVLEHEGTIDKIVGDALHGFFGAPLACDDHADKAMKSAMSINSFAQEFIETDEAKALGFGVTRIGVHTGTAVVGNFGGESFFDYTAHGDVINTTSRLESANKYLGTSICVSNEVRECCSQLEFRPIGQILLVGKTESLLVYEPVDSACQDISDLSSYLEAYHLMDTGDPGAVEAFTQLAAQHPMDKLVCMHCARLQGGDSGSHIVMRDK